MRIGLLLASMPRLNIYLPNEVFELTEKWRDSANLSEICARAIRDEFEAADNHRAPRTLLQTLAPPTEFERELASAYDLQEAIVIDAPDNEASIRDRLGAAAALYLDQAICDGSLLGIAGGRQTWCMVRSLSPRRVRATITALGFGQADPQLLHAHPNTLATLAWLLYSPRSEAHVIGAGHGNRAWSGELPRRDHATYFIFASCSRFDKESSFARLIGEKSVEKLLHEDVVAEFANVFLDSQGSEVSLPVCAQRTTLSGDLLRTLARRSDVRIVLIAGGATKLEPIRLTLAARLCNALVTDAATARALLGTVGDVSDGNTEYRNSVSR